MDANGNTVALYKYDPYGNPIHASGSLATINPLRYRGYYYDSETGLYYLQSRYYDPVVGRFINSDEYTSTGQGILGNNMFAYCGNNPICRADASGKLYFTVLGAVVGAAFGALDAAIQGKTGKEFTAAVASGAVSGAISGAAADVLTITGAAVGTAVITMSISSAVGSYIGIKTSDTITGQATPKKELIGEVVSDAGLGALFAYMGGDIPSKLSKISQKGFWNVVKNTIKNEAKNTMSNIAEEALTTVTGGVAKLTVSVYKRAAKRTVRMWTK